MPATNSLNINTTGIVSYNATTGVFTQSSLTQYSTLVGGASNAIVSVGPGSAGQILQSGGGAANPAYSTATYPSTTTINQLLYSSSANTVVGLATSNNGVLITSAGGVPSLLANGTTGQVLTATTGSPPSWSTITTPLTWTNVTGPFVTVAGGTGYINNNGTLVTYTLPASPTQGQTFSIAGGTSGAATSPWIIAQPALQQINFGNTSSTVGITGSVASTLRYDAVELLCVTGGVSAVWVVLSSVGNLIVT